MHEAERLLQASPFGSLLMDSQVTDITYNGDTLFYVSSQRGRASWSSYAKADALNLIRQIANLTDQLFTYQNPILDVVFAHYRLSAVHPLISRDAEEGAPSFALRIANRNINLLRDMGTIDDHLETLLKQVLQQKKSIVISGQTGVGKTELQKFLLGLLEPHQRVVIIDQGVELVMSKTLYPHLDLTVWKYQLEKEETGLANLIKTSLRFNPDYIVIAEARGHEICDIYNATLSGHPSIFTMHSDSEDVIHKRMAAMSGYSPTLTKEEYVRVFPLVIHLTKVICDGMIKRKIKCIVDYGQQQGKGIYLYIDEENKKKSD